MPHAKKYFRGFGYKKWVKGAENPSARGRIPGLSLDDLDCSLEDIIEYLSSGFTPDFDVAGGSMAAVVENTSQLITKDMEMIAQYLIDFKKLKLNPANLSGYLQLWNSKHQYERCLRSDREYK